VKPLVLCPRRRRQRPVSAPVDCAKHPSGACDGCLEDLEAAQAYRELAERITKEADR
jgi:hypothetical protein